MRLKDSADAVILHRAKAQTCEALHVATYNNNLIVWALFSRFIYFIHMFSLFIDNTFYRWHPVKSKVGTRAQRI